MVSNSYLERVRRNLRLLLDKNPYLIGKTREHGGYALLCLVYWREFEGLEFKLPSYPPRLTSPETITRVLREMKLGRENRTGESLRDFVKSGG